MHVDKISDRLINNHGEAIAIRKASNPEKIGALQKRVAGELAE